MRDWDDEEGVAVGGHVSLRFSLEMHRNDRIENDREVLPVISNTGQCIIPSHERREQSEVSTALDD